MTDLAPTITDTLNILKSVLNVPKNTVFYKGYADTNSLDPKACDNQPLLNKLLTTVEKNKKLILRNDLGQDKDFQKVYTQKDSLKAFIGMPLLGLKESLVGVFYIYFDSVQNYSKRTETLLKAVLKQAGVSYTNELRIEKLKREKKHIFNENLKRKKIIESTQAASWFWNIEHEALEISPQWAAMVGYTIKELEPINYDMWANLVHPDDIKLAENAIQECFSQIKEFYNINFRMFHKAGHYVWINSSGFITEWSLDDKPLFMVGAHIDISSQKKTEEILKRNKWHLEEVQRISNIGSWSYDVLAKEFLFSKGFSDLLKKPTHQSFEEVMENVFEEDKAMVRKAKSECVKLGKPFEINYRTLNPEGNTVHIEEHGFAIKNEENKIINIYGTLHDVTEKKKEQQHLKLLESVITNTKDAVLITEAEPFEDPGPKIIYVNEAFTTMTGYTPEDVIGKSPRILQGPKSDFKALSKLGEALRKWESHEVTTINYKKNGEEFWCNFTVVPVPDETGWYTHWIAIERDITEQVNKLNAQKLFNEIGSFFTEYEILGKALDASLSSILGMTEFSCGEIWITNDSRKNFELISSAFLDQKGENFALQNSIFEIELHKTFQGEILKKKKPYYLNDIQNNPLFVRKEIAKQTKLQDALGIPLMANDEIQGVLLLLSDKKLQPSKYKRPLFKDLIDFLGKEIKRKNLEIEFNDAFNITPNMLTISDGRNYFKRVNPATIKILGYSEEELLSQSFMNFIHPEDRNSTMDQAGILSSGHPVYNFENRYITKSGDIVWLSWAATPSFSNGLTYSVAKDVTERKKTQAKLNELNLNLKKHAYELEQKNKMLQNIAWTQSHKIRAPLARILGILESIDLLTNGRELTEDEVTLFNGLKESGLELDTMIKKVVKKTDF
ncbi:PAS domain S-box protein [Gaetbulibacter sp. M240]|uniref:PAS domain S-box protein n=1 Tax=Gaetbulibacter sp. M240 TaxID=3126511 RepID=UPI00374FB755